MDPIVIQLNSLTVFWDELGLPKRPNESQKNVLADWWDEEIEPWLSSVPLLGRINPHESGVWFENRRDAMLFKVRWAGQGPDLR